MKKHIKKALLLLLIIVSIFSFSGCEYMFLGFAQLARIVFMDDFREDYLKEMGMTEEDCLPIEEIKSQESYRFNGCVYNIVDLDEYYKKGYSGRFYQWRDVGNYLDNGYSGGKAEIVGLKAGKIGYYVGGMTPVVYVSIYDENWDMIAYHLRDYVKEGVEIPLIAEAKFTGVSVKYSYYETINTTFEQSIMLKDIVDFDKMYNGEDFCSTGFTMLFDIEGLPYLQSGNFSLHERNGEWYIYQSEGHYWHVQEEYQFLLKNMARQAQEGTYNETNG